MELKIAVLPGDGIGPEISAQGVDVMTAVCEKFGHKVEYKYAICGAVFSSILMTNCPWLSVFAIFASITGQTLTQALQPTHLLTSRQILPINDSPLHQIFRLLCQFAELSSNNPILF